ncbi:hypothetical protein SAMN06265222_12171 [Neorhodopirellula lusitana]|uniref:Recombination-associated protein RdgC n=1 Tax=Neorhodopirellula lusitana TaxID=445327 RepID=A0ABY1QRH6_9BACT|nr:hypothetical protein [Neorhodopirellula lusitana]SMP76550.1 hypothetical protein SAMN06265222_12171 [Neorhodopirellula lusitana]
MPFLSGSLSFERFRVSKFDSETFDQEHLDKMMKHTAGNVETSSTENVHTGFLGGAHLFDQDFDLNKNVINEAVHFGIRIDTNSIPSAIKNAWMSMELAAAARDNPSGVATKSQRKEAKEAVEQRCEVEASTGKYRKFQPFALLWDTYHEMLYFGGTAGTASGHCADLLERVFEVELGHVSAGTIAQDWALASDRYAEMDDVMPASFVEGQSISSVAWANEHSKSPDFLGNEFLLWLWWMLETQTEVIALPDEGEVTVMLAKTLSLECPVGENGKETISAEFPTSLPEAMQAIQHGKLPRKTGMTIIRDGQQFDLTLQAETFGISGAKIVLDEDVEDFGPEDRIDAVRQLSDTVDGMLHTFCDLRTGTAWEETRLAMQEWLAPATKQSKRKAA